MEVCPSLPDALCSGRDHPAYCAGFHKIGPERNHDTLRTARGTHGEANAAKRLAEMEPRLLSLLGEKSRDEGTRAVRRFRDGAYTLVCLTERRIRAAAADCFGGTPRMKDYTAYVAPKGAKPDPEDDVTDATPAENTANPA
ncbi:MAG: hypothetical protein U0441_21110 [Polyangiaceae bacterium]